MKLKNHSHANCSVCKSNGWIILKSYKTDIIIIDNLGWLYINELYNPLTMKHISYFLQEFVPGLSFQAAKKLFENNESCNIYTGEIKSNNEIADLWCKD